MRENALADRLAELGLFAQRRHDPELALREFFCPACATCLHTQVQPEGAPIIDDGVGLAGAGAST
jgi:acetone carboxylase gamma subunit